MIPKRNIDELLMQYRLHPESRDLFVEGSTDRAVFSHLFKEARPFGASIRWIEDIDLGGLAKGVEGGAKGRILALAKFAEEKSLVNIVCVVDRNLDDVLDIAGRTYLHPTIYPDLEFHLLRSPELDAVVALAFARDLPSTAIEDALCCARFAFTTKMVLLKRIGIYSAVTFEKSLRKVGNRTTLELKSYLTRLDSRNKAGGKFLSCLDEVESEIKISGDDDNFMFVEFHVFEDILKNILVADRFDSQLHQDWLGKIVRSSIYNLRALDVFFLSVLQRINS